MIDLFNLKPGRELDALIAETVMGWSWRNEPELGPCWRDDKNSTIYRDDYDQLPEFSNDIGAAWQVVDRVSSIGSVFKAETPLWGCGLSNGKIVHGVSAPHAICLAALRAVSGLIV